MGEQGHQEACNKEAWDRFMEAERRQLELRRNSLLARLLGPALPDESPAELKRLAEEDRLRAEESLVDLMDERGQISYKHIDELTPEDRRARTRAEGVRIKWIADRLSRRPIFPPGPGLRGPSDWS
jgi:hypothetical protein